MSKLITGNVYYQLLSIVHDTTAYFDSTFTRINVYVVLFIYLLIFQMLSIKSRVSFDAIHFDSLPFTQTISTRVKSLLRDMSDIMENGYMFPR